MKQNRPIDVSQAMGRLRGWPRLVVMGILVAVFLYVAWQKQAGEGPRPEGPVSQQQRGEESPAASVSTSDAKAETEATPEAPTKGSEPAPRTVIANQTIRSEEGKVVFRGEIDVGPTLERIRRGERLKFSHDGTTFQNRERRLPRQGDGYYKEYVHPTRGVSGPGPQRIVVGRGGEIFYTPDHYRTFERLDGR